MSEPKLSATTIPVWAWFLPMLPLSIFFYEYQFGLDEHWFLVLNRLSTSFPDLLWTGLSLLGNGWSVLGVALPLVIFARRSIYAALLSGIFAGIFSDFLKDLANTKRPAGVLDQSLFRIIDNPLLYSAMPSGHTMTAFSIATAIFFSLSKKRHPAWNLLFVLAIGTGLSRIAVGAHWPQDTLVGAALGIYAGLIGAFLAKQIPERFLQTQAWPLKAVFVGSLVSFYFLVADTLDFSQNQYLQYVIAGVIVLTWAMVYKSISSQPRS
jgi:membrane-associated phospholipid phosphatase